MVKMIQTTRQYKRTLDKLAMQRQKRLESELAILDCRIRRLELTRHLQDVAGCQSKMGEWIRSRAAYFRFGSGHIAL